MHYAAATAWLDSLANLERRPSLQHWTSIKLARVEHLLRLLGQPHQGLRAVHLAGSKGKGSTAAMVEAVLRHAGYATGLYTSPHLVSSRERVRLSGQPLTEAAVAALVGDFLQPAVEAYRRESGADDLSYFDVHTVMAFLAFRHAEVEVAVVEVGLGGRLDATNVLTPAVSVITPIGLEHTAFLGDTLAAIAGEKAGIIKPGVPVVCGRQPDEAAAVIAARAAELGAPLLPAAGVTAAGPPDLARDPVGQPVTVDWGATTMAARLPLLGSHQVDNAACAVTALAQVGLPLTATQVAEGLATTRWPGRLQVLRRRPWLILDGAHTLESADSLRRSLDLWPPRRRWFVLAAAHDKDFAAFAARLLPGAAGIVLAAVPDNPRLAAPETLLATAQEYAPASVAGTPRQAVETALAQADPEDLVCVTGSLYLVGAVLADQGLTWG